MIDIKLDFSKQGVRDWFVMLLMAGIWIAATVFLFKHPEGPAFAVWGTVCGTMTAAYHWLDVHDSKVPDAHIP